MIWRSDLRSAGKSEGFSLIEVVVGLGLVSIVVTSVLSVIQLSNFVMKSVEEKDRSSISALYSIEYIKDEIKRSDEVHKIESCSGLSEQYPNNFGFILMEVIRNNALTRYNYKTYYVGDGTIKRIAYNSIVRKMPAHTRFSGFNVVAEDIASIEGTCLDFENELINLILEVAVSDGTTEQYMTAVSVKGRVMD